MNESYPTSTPLKSTYVSLDSLADVISDLSEIEADVFGPLDRLGLAPSQDVMNKIYSFL